MPVETPELITSFKNPKIQLVRDLLSSRKSREENSACVIEGVRLSEEAVRSGVLPETVLFTGGLSTRGMELLRAIPGDKTAFIKIPPDLMRKISATEADQGLMLIIPLQSSPAIGKVDFVLILDQVKDPGNVGTILRTASAAGAQAVIMAPGCVDPFSPKVLRSGMGAHFNIPIASLTWPQITEFCRRPGNNLNICLAEATSGISMWTLDFHQPIVIVIGSEADGASVEAKQAANTVINIPMPGGSESLNASVAAGIILYEVVRQRSL
jgi:TrmH family RNA methyltransferase